MGLDGNFGDWDEWTGLTSRYFSERGVCEGRLRLYQRCTRKDVALPGQ